MLKVLGLSLTVVLLRLPDSWCRILPQSRTAPAAFRDVGAVSGVRCRIWGLRFRAHAGVGSNEVLNSCPYPQLCFVLRALFRAWGVANSGFLLGDSI